MCIKTLTKEDFADSMGVEVSSLCNDVLDFLAKKNFNYSIPVGKERDAIIINRLQEIKSDTQIIGASYRVKQWHNGWKENLDMFLETGDLESIVPKFVRPVNIFRYKGDFIVPEDCYFERNIISLIQLWFFKNYIEPFDYIYEFGCGSGMNIIPMSIKFPEKKIIGTDFVQTSVDLINVVAEKKELHNLSAQIFDMITPDLDFEILPNSCVFTFGAIEQLASKFTSFVNFLTSKPLNICFHIEPVIELYDPSSLVDYLDMEIYEKRGYSKGFLPLLQASPDVEILKVQRTGFGNFRQEGYNIITWRPRVSK